MLLYGMAYYPQAIEFLRHSLRLYGRDAATLYNLGMCHFELGQLDEALSFINQALAVDSAFEPARAMRIKIEEVCRNLRLSTLPRREIGAIDRNVGQPH